VKGIVLIIRGEYTPTDVFSGAWSISADVKAERTGDLAEE
jgi:hypothetical protein